MIEHTSPQAMNHNKELDLGMNLMLYNNWEL